MPACPQWSLSLMFSHQKPVHTSPLPYTCYMPYPPHFSWFLHQHNSGWEVQIIKHLIMKFSPLPWVLWLWRMKSVIWKFIKN
jgi:hypothetical protein